MSIRLYGYSAQHNATAPEPHAKPLSSAREFVIL